MLAFALFLVLPQEQAPAEGVIARVPPGIVARAQDWGLDYRSVAWIGLGPDGLQRLYVDDKPGAAFDEIHTLSWNPAWTAVWYLARRKTEHFLVLGERAHPIPDYGTTPHWSPDGLRCAWMSSRNGKPVLMLNDEPAAEAAAFLTYGFRPPDHELAWVLPGPQGPVLHAGKTKRPMPHLAGYVAWTSDGARCAYRGEVAGKKGKTVHMIVDGKAGPAFDDVNAPRWSEDGKTLFYMGQVGPSKWIVRNHERVESFESLFTCRQGPDGRLLATGMRSGRHGALVGAVWTPTELRGVSPITTSADGSRVAWTEWGDKTDRVRVGDQTYGPYERATSVSFTKKGEARFSFKAGVLWHVWIEGRICPLPPNAIFARVLDDGRVQAPYLHEGREFRVDLLPPP